MPLDSLPGKLVLPSRNSVRDKWLRDYSLRAPSVKTDEGTLPWIEASTFADATGVHRSNAVTIANGVSRATATGVDLDDWATRLGTFRLPPVGGAGFVSITTTTTANVTIQYGQILTGPSNTRYQCIQAGQYGNQAQVPVAGITTGPKSNQNAGTVLTWQSPPVGLAASATVIQQADGSGISGGNNLETDDQLRARLDYIAANPPASGNDSQYQSYIMVTPGLSVQQAFTFPAVPGPGSTSYALTLRPSTPGANRIPNAAQLAIATAFLTGLMPGDDGIFACSLVSSPVTVVLEVAWAQGAAGWADATTFPVYHSPIGASGVSAAATAGGVLTSTTFRLTSAAMSADPAPVVGQSVAFLDAPNNTFRRKKLLTVTTISSTAYDVTVDTTAGLSDSSYTPASGQSCCPWSDSLNVVLPPLNAYFDTLGPGEQFHAFFDPGLRQRRNPANPQYWPATVTSRILGGGVIPQSPQGPQQNQPPTPTLLSLPQLLDVLVEEPVLPHTTPVGSPAIASYLLTLSNVVVFPGG
jgi:hypothetical protein